MKKLNQWIDRFAYSHPRFGIPNLMLYIVIANAVTYILTLFAGSAALSFLKFDLYHVLHGEVWRLVTFVLLPFTYRPISLFIMLSFCYFVGGTLEREWGTAKFTLYYLSGMLFSVLSTVILSLATGYYGWSLSDAYYINLTMFLAFAVMYPDAGLVLRGDPSEGQVAGMGGHRFDGVEHRSVRAVRCLRQCSGRCGGNFELCDLLLGGYQEHFGDPEPSAVQTDHSIQVRRPAAEEGGDGARLPPQVRGLRPHGR